MDLFSLVRLAGQASLDFLDWTGVNTNLITLSFTEFWVQEFGSDKSSYPLFHEPKAGALMTKLPQKDPTKATTASNIIHHKVKPGTMIIFPSYLPHQFALDLTGEPFRFIHWNMQAILK